MKTPEEIKKGLECCFAAREYRNCLNCPYGIPKKRYSILCDCEVKQDTLAYIQQLERERDMAVDDIECGICCETCAHYDTPTSDPPCAICNKGWAEHGNWQWRGVKNDG